MNESLAASSAHSPSVIVDVIIYTGAAVLLGALVYIVWNYARHLRDSPRELWLLFISKITEYSAYGAMNATLVLFLTSHCDLSDVGAGSFIGVWSMAITLTMMFVGAICDAIGIKKTLLLGTSVLVLARLVMPVSTNIYVLTVFGFVPLAMGIAVIGPVLSVGVKRYTTKETSAMGFALLYVFFNIGWAGGAWIFDTVRVTMGEHGTMSIVGRDFSTYQTIFLVSLALTVVTVATTLLMRDGVELKESGELVIEPIAGQRGTSFINGVTRSVKKAGGDTLSTMRTVITEKPFWIFLFMIGILVFVRVVFYHFHYTFPPYALRTLGEGMPFGSVYGLLNPVIIVFLAPVVAIVTRKASSYVMLTIGSSISASAVFIAALPERFFEPLMTTWFAELVLDRWLAVPIEAQKPQWLVLVVMVVVFTVGEAIWSPRLMQFTAAIAPKGREGSYIALSYLPYFASKIIVGPMSGWLVATYVPEDASSYPHHYVVWLWIGGMALISPLGLLGFRSLYTRAEREGIAGDQKEDAEGDGPKQEGESEA